KFAVFYEYPKQFLIVSTFGECLFLLPLKRLILFSKLDICALIRLNLQTLRYLLDVTKEFHHILLLHHSVYVWKTKSSCVVLIFQSKSTLLVFQQDQGRKPVHPEAEVSDYE